MTKKLMTYTKKDYEMFKLALELAITAPTGKLSNECLRMVENLSTMFPEDIIEKAKREIGLY